MKPKTSTEIPTWNNATHRGCRRLMIRRALKMSVRERLQALETLNHTGLALASLKKCKP